MTDKFANLEDQSKIGTVAGCVLVLAIIGVFFVLVRWPAAAPRSVTGTVQTSGAVSVARVAGGTREAASVRLENGNLVIAQVGANGPFAPGDKVRLIEQSRFMGGPAYQVVAKVSGQ
jgi:hypothetical protein